TRNLRTRLRAELRLSPFGVSLVRRPVRRVQGVRGSVQVACQRRQLPAGAPFAAEPRACGTRAGDAGTLPRMAKIELRIRRLDEGDVLVAEFPDEESAEAWLRERPPFVEVLRMETPVPVEIEARLRAAMRPLDERERGRQDEHQRALLTQRTAEIRQVQLEEEESRAPDRLMHLQWQRGRGL